ncbi:hypothetical protein Q9L42_010485 [Methylomarinum sp. Ch1-1]|uniref:Terminase small subunit n=1 Tax=Methylomarinum roseum TaxID=3067653 RepID=A0AAU7NPB0_9GAMM|nr:hypothetical protein [Methylomarinum sp. Ch1-1]MDP4521317.1 hypothetical protein [Methylomarinum sp. Ch1-1]
MSQQVFADAVGITQPVVSDLCRRQILNQGGTFGDWVRRYCGHLQSQADERAACGDLDLAFERAALARAHREKIEMQNDAKRREYGPIDELDAGVDRVLAAVSERIGTIPSRVESSVVALTPHEMNIVSGVVDEVQQTLKEAKINWFDEQDGEEVDA